MNRKAMELPMNLMVIAIAALIGLIVYLLFATGTIQRLFSASGEFTDCEKGQSGTCRDSCEEGEIRLPGSYGCKDSYCCKKLNPEAPV